MCSVLLLYIREAAAGLDHPDDKKEHQQGVTNCLQCSVDIDDDIPDGAALEGLRRLCDQRPYF